jgi:hypothetical protein
MMKLLRAAPFFLLACAAAAACGNSDDDNTTGGGGTSGSCTPPADQCTLLTTDEAATALGVATTTSMEGTMGPGDPSINEPSSGECSWVGAGNGDSSNQIVVTYICGAEDVALSAEEMVMKEEIGAGMAVAVSGVGSAADWALTSTATLDDDAGVLSGGILTAVTGSGYITVTIVGEGTPDELQARATVAAGLVISRL